MGRKKSASKSQATFVDDEASLSVIENQEFMAMRAAQKIWPAPTTTEDQLRVLISDGLIQSKDIVTEPTNYTKLSKKIIHQSRRLNKLKPV